MKDYYQIMELTREATEADVKRSFRRLAVRYHPDKNPSKEAENLFKEINEAYEVLSDPERRSRYDQLLLNQGTHYQWQQTYVRPQPRATRPSERQVVLMGMLRYAQMLFYFGSLWSFTLLVDYVMPSRILVDRVVSDPNSVSKLINREHHDLLQTEQGYHFPVLLSEHSNFPLHSQVKIHVSGIFGAVIKVENYNDTFIVNNLGTIYRNFSFAPILLILCCAVGIVVRTGVEFHVNLGIVVFLLMILNIVFLYKSIL